MAVEELIPAIPAEAIATIIASIFLFLFLLIALYIYTSFAYMAIGRKAKSKTPGIAWIPAIGPSLIALQAAKMHWWPLLLLIGLFIPMLGIIFVPAFMVFSTIWHWKMFEKIGRPGWWAILCLIPIVDQVMIGIAAWGKK